jgi:hypothetical protein
MAAFLSFITAAIWLYLGYISLFDKDRAWLWYSGARKFRGLTPERTADWDYQRVRNGYLFVLAGLVALVAALALMN